MQWFLLSVFFATSTTIKFPRKEPFIAYRAKHVPDECRPNDPLTMCGGEVLGLMNPGFKPVVVTLHCSSVGNEYDEAEVEVPAKAQLEVTIELSNSNLREPCYMSRWKEKK